MCMCHVSPSPFIVQSSTWNDTLTLRGLRLSPTMMLVFELYNAKPTVAGLPTREAMVAWAYTSLLHKGEVCGWAHTFSDSGSTVTRRQLRDRLLVMCRAPDSLMTSGLEGRIRVLVGK
eukprot:364478-Chlamydomonas_euryale.AAC.12